MSHLLCIGLGYTAERVARLLLAKGWRVSGTARSAAAEERIRSLGVEAIHFDGGVASIELSQSLSEASHLVVSVPPANDADPVLRLHGEDLAARNATLWIGYLSTLGVYGDHAGGWVDEDTPVAPINDRSKARVAAEAAWLDLGRRTGLMVEIFRLAGIYGPGRSAIDSVRAGTARRIIKPGQIFNRIHVDDIATVLEAAIGRPRPGAIYNVADDEPAPPQDVIAYAAQLLGVPPPPALRFEDAELSPMARSFYEECKRADNSRLKRELGVRLAFPTYREGLRAILEAQRGP
jgi:dTDP-4-dehydrorhamnose reductase